MWNGILGEIITIDSNVFPYYFNRAFIISLLTNVIMNRHKSNLPYAKATPNLLEITEHNHNGTFSLGHRTWEIDWERLFSM